MEASPIAFGILSPTTTLSFSEDGPAPPTQQYTLGGSIENFAAITCCAANTVINPSAGLNTVTLGIQSSCLCYDEVFDLRVAAGTGSYAVGMSVAGYTDPIQQDATIGTQNFAFPRTVASNSQTSYVVSDGGNMLNDNIVSFLQRKITRILAFVNCEQTLAPPSVWNPNGTVPYQTTFMDKSVAALFNVIGTDTTYSSEISFYTARNHFFPTADFYKLATALQAAQAAGNGIVTTTSHVTVANAFYGIPAGFHVNITWFYLSRATTWESKLSADMQARVVPPAGTPLNVNFPNGTFANFPNYVTAPLSINYTQANLLADFTGWAVLQNADLYRKALLGV